MKISCPTAFVLLLANHCQVRAQDLLYLEAHDHMAASVPLQGDAYKGCWNYDAANNPTLDYHATGAFEYNVESCRAECNNAGYAYAGLTRGVSCYCGNSYDAGGQAYDSDCSDACVVQPTSICGGFNKVSVYASSDGYIAPVVTPEPTYMPSPAPTTLDPTNMPSPGPTTMEPTNIPTPESTPEPTNEPTPLPTPEPTEMPTLAPTRIPTTEPTPMPTNMPTPQTTPWPTTKPTLKSEANNAASSLQNDTGSCYIGCYKDSAQSQTMTITLSGTHYVYTCVAGCKKLGYPVAGLRLGRACWCGIGYDEQRITTKKCVNDRNSVWNTGITGGCTQQPAALSSMKPTMSASTSMPTPGPLTAPPQLGPTKKPSTGHANNPTPGPTTKQPTSNPTAGPTKKPSPGPTTTTPTPGPTNNKPTPGPTNTSPPTPGPTRKPTPWPITSQPTPGPTEKPKAFPTPGSTTNPPTKGPTRKPTPGPTTRKPTPWPTTSPTTLGPTTSLPTAGPTKKPTLNPTPGPTTRLPTLAPTTRQPTPAPTILPATAPGSTSFNIDLSMVNLSNGQTFTDAKLRWEQIIVADLPAWSGNLPSNNPCTSNSLWPLNIDDVHICSITKYIDGPGNVLGYAGPRYVRNSGHTIVGEMVFEEGYTPDYGTVIHEMGHVLGIGTLWGWHGLATNTVPCHYKLDSKASEMYRAISGCTGSAPTEQSTGRSGSDCGHWSDSCFRDERMTFNGGSKISTVTIGSLEDMGYRVDYTKADVFSKSNLGSSCVCNRRLRSGGMNQTENGQEDFLAFSSHRTLNEETREIAVEFGLELLQARQDEQTTPTSSKGDDYNDVGSSVVMVLVEDENGNEFGVRVEL